MPEGFRPVSNTPPDSLKNSIKFYGRMLLDLQINTIFKDVKKVLPKLKGEVLDIGCGQSPYNFLLNPKKTTYYGIDIIDAEKFDYNNSRITPFNGKDIPFEDEKFDAFICTEVLEHVPDFNALVTEIYRVSKPGAVGIVTIPWSARYHYIPYDYFRYTPSSLESLFSKFSQCEIKARGTDIATICSKIIVSYFRNVSNANFFTLFKLPLLLLFLPVFLACVIIAHLALTFNLGSKDDPLGYTVFLKK